MSESTSNTTSILGDSIIETTTDVTSNPVRRGVQDIIYLSSAEDEDQTEQVNDENDADVMETETDDDEAEYLKSRGKQPRLDPSALEDSKKLPEAAPPPVEEEVIIFQKAHFISSLFNK